MIDDAPNNNSLPNLSVGYVRLYRSISSKGWWKKSEHAHLFLHLLLKASHSGYETWISGKNMRLQPGQLVTGRKKLSDETGINESKVERILKVFETEQQIKQETFSTSRLISICNWITYQSDGQQNEQRVNNERTTGEQQLNTIQEGKEGIKNGKKVKSIAEGTIINPFSGEFLPVWEEYLRFRREQHRFTYKQLSAQQKAIDALHDLAGGNESVARQIVDQSITNGWKGLFPLSQANKTTAARKDTAQHKNANEYEWKQN